MIKLVRGAAVPCDGTLLSSSDVLIDESMITGESLPVLKTLQSNCIAGTIVTEGMGYVKVDSVGQDTAVSQIVELMANAQSGKAPIQHLADKISGLFVPVVLACSFLSFAVWLIAGLSGALPGKWTEEHGVLMFSVMFGIATLVIACPCALGLAAPTAIMVGTGVGAKNGILIKGGGAMESAAKVTAVIFDKTGTITMGKPAVDDFVEVAAEADEETVDVKNLLYLIVCAEKSSEHPLALAVVKYCTDRLAGTSYEDKIHSPADFKAITGKGVSCVVDGKTVGIGNRPFMKIIDVKVAEDVNKQLGDMENEGKTAIMVSIDGKLRAIMGISDQLKPDSPETIKRLKSMGIDVWMVTGDNQRTARAIAKKIGLSEHNIVAEALPATKVLQVENLQQDGKIVAMVGDGINDSPALVQANVGIAIGAGTEIAIEAAQMVLVRNCISDVVVALELSKSVFNRIKLNFFWALGYNCLGIPLAAGIFYPWLEVTLPPSVAGAAMALSSVSVVASSLLLRFWRPSWRIDSAEYRPAN
jgi:Cu+-exporting ATPase